LRPVEVVNEVDLRDFWPSLSLCFESWSACAVGVVGLRERGLDVTGRSRPDSENTSR
jgi:hypothetical protein